MQKLSTILKSILVIYLFFFSAYVWALDHVILISWDGAGSHYIKDNKELKNLKSLVSRSHYTFESQSESPTITLPNHTSMLTGLPPSLHQVLWNKWEPEKGLVTRMTVFDAVKMSQKKEAVKTAHTKALARSLTTAMFTGKEKLAHLYKKEVVDDYRLSASAAETSKHLVERIQEGKLANFTFVHFAEPDVAGHEFGWGSDEYKKALAECDLRLGEIVAAVAQKKLDGKTAIILTADHGGEGKSHREETVIVRNIPLIVSTPKTKHTSKKISAPVSNASIAGIATHLLEVDVPKDWGWKAGPKF